MAFKLFSLPGRQTVSAFLFSLLISNTLIAQQGADYSALNKSANRYSPLSLSSFEETGHGEHPEHITGINRYDRILRQGGTVLLKTYTPDQYAGKDFSTLETEFPNWKGLDLKTRKGTTLLSIWADEIISLQSLLSGKLFDPLYFKQVILKSASGAADIAANRELLRQLIALELNSMAVSNALLKEFRIEFDSWLVTQQMDTETTGESILMPCGNGMDSKIIYSWKFPAGLKKLLGTDNTVAALQDLTIEVLAGKKKIAKTQYADLLTGIQMINEAFGSGRYLLGWSNQFVNCSNSWILQWKFDSPVLSVPVGEGTFSTEAMVLNKMDQTILQVKGLTDSRVLIELYSEKGSRVEKFYHGKLSGGESLQFVIKSSGKTQGLIYKVSADGKTYSGLIP